MDMFCEPGTPIDICNSAAISAVTVIPERDIISTVLYQCSIAYVNAHL